MLIAGMPTFATSVGVAPSTTTMTIPNAAGLGATRYYDPYASIEDLRSSSAGLGIINETDAWLTGRPYGLPGTAAIKIDHNARNGAEMLGGAMLGQPTAADMAALLVSQREQAESLKRLAFWQNVFGYTFVGLAVIGVARMIYNSAREDERDYERERARRPVSRMITRQRTA